MSTTRSVVLELVEFIRSENIKSLVAHLVEKFGPQLEEVDYVDTFRALRLRYDQVRLNCSGITSGQSPPRLSAAHSCARVCQLGVDTFCALRLKMRPGANKPAQPFFFALALALCSRGAKGLGFRVYLHSSGAVLLRPSVADIGVAS